VNLPPTLEALWVVVFAVHLLLVVLHVVASRSGWVRNQLRFGFGAMAAGAVVVASVSARVGATRIPEPPPALAVMTTVLLFVGWCGIFLAFYCIVTTSVRFRMCVECARADRELEASELLGLYRPEAAGAERFDRLVVSGNARLEGDRIGLTAKGRRLGQVFSALRDFYREPEDSR
jgi:hypothetical protein